MVKHSAKTGDRTITLKCHLRRTLVRACDPHELLSLNSWPQISGTVWERIGDVDFIGGGVPLGAGFEVSVAHATPS